MTFERLSPQEAQSLPRSANHIGGPWPPSFRLAGVYTGRANDINI